VKVGILGHEFIKWSGGVDFLCTVIDSLLEAAPAGTETTILIPDLPPRWNWRRSKFRAAMKEAFGGKTKSREAPSLDSLDPAAFSEFEGRARIHRIVPDRRSLLRAAKELDVLLPAFISLGPDFPKPWVGYVYDFQHKYLPENFSPEDARARDSHFATMLGEARAVIVNSRSAAGDIARFFPQAKARVFALPFAPAPQNGWLTEIPGVLEQYKITEPFFMVSNQFWIHKDHGTAFEAFRKIAAENPGVSLVCTGTTRDARRPEYFAGLMERVKGWGLEARVRVLGQIPKRDQIEIMKHARAVLQPTRFEGGPGGGAVYDAVALGVPVIVSDLPVNREVESSQIQFFPPGDAGALAGHMRQALLAAPSQKDWEGIRQTGRRRRAACGNVLWEAVKTVAA
jgi:glycosyltransferase involved in cell wall biosynthesis